MQNPLKILLHLDRRNWELISADEYMLVSGMEEAVLIYMEAIKNLLEI